MHLVGNLNLDITGKEMSIKYNRITVLGSYLRFLIYRNSSKKIIIGAAGQKIDGYLLTEEKYFNVENSFNWHKSFTQDTLEAIIAEHVWEHLNYPRIAIALCYDYLKNDGILTIAVPDGDDLQQVKQNYPPKWGHKSMFTEKQLINLFQQAGFKDIKRVNDIKIHRKDSLTISGTK